MNIHQIHTRLSTLIHLNTSMYTKVRGNQIAAFCTGFCKILGLGKNEEIKPHFEGLYFMNAYSDVAKN